MADPTTIREIVERAVGAALDAQMPKLREEVVQRVLAELGPAMAPEGGTASERLRTALQWVEQATAQSDILRALLEGAATFCGRAAIFLVRGRNAVGWQARGFRENDALRQVTLDLKQGLAGRVYQQCVSANGPVGQFDSGLVARFGAPSDGECLVWPLIIRDKVAALVYADAGPERAALVDSAALETLVRTTGLWLELLAMRRSSGTLAPQAVPPPPTKAPAQAAVLAPPANAAAATSTTAMAMSAASAPVATPAPVPAVPSEPALATPVPMPGSINPDADETHRKARRFAKLLVDEIKLYNQAKVAEGRLHRDLYERLKDDIDKSRATYDKRYAQTAIAANDYFTQELVRGLADGERRLLGSNFPR